MEPGSSNGMDPLGHSIQLNITHYTSNLFFCLLIGFSL